MGTAPAPGELSVAASVEQATNTTILSAIKQREEVAPMVKIVLYASEDVDSDFVKRLLQLHADWEATRGQRAMYPTCDHRRIRRNENGIGLEIDRLPLAMPTQYVDVPLTLVTIDDEYLDDNGLMKAGTYRRGRTTAVVTERTNRPSDGREPYESWKIEVTGKSLVAVVNLYTDIRAGKVEPRVSWSAESEDDKQ